MRVFIYEYICGGGLAGCPLPESLVREGWAMLASIAEDFARVEGCEVTTTLDARLAGRPLAAHHVDRLLPENEHATICRVASQCNWTMVIAPEFDGILLDRVRWVEVAGGRLLGPTSAGVAATADKLECGKLLERAGVAAVTGRVVSLNELSADNFPVGFPAVLKPVDGAGSQTTFLIPDRASVRRVLGEAAAEGVGAKALVQPFIPGIPASVSFLIGPVGTVPLLAGEQLLSNDGRFRYQGGRIPLPQELAARAVALAARSVIAVPGLRGFVGVDLVLEDAAAELQIAKCDLRPTDSVLEEWKHDSPPSSRYSVLSTQYPSAVYPMLSTQYSVPSAQAHRQSDTDPGEFSVGATLQGQDSANSSIRNPQSAIRNSSTPRDVVIEINPRLTTSYVGLRALARCNLAIPMLEIVNGRRPDPIEWRHDTIGFSADGRLT